MGSKGDRFRLTGSERITSAAILSPIPEKNAHIPDCLVLISAPDQRICESEAIKRGHVRIDRGHIRRRYCRKANDMHSATVSLQRRIAAGDVPFASVADLVRNSNLLLFPSVARCARLASGGEKSTMNKPCVEYFYGLSGSFWLFLSICRPDRALMSLSKRISVLFRAYRFRYQVLRRNRGAPRARFQIS